jgi:VanZ family protein
MNKKKYRLAVLWAVFIFCLHIIPSEKLPSTPDWGFSVDKVVHFFLFVVLGYLLVRSFKPDKRHWSRLILYAVMICVIFGLIMETVQIIVPGRTYNMVDLVADGTGAAFGCLVFVGLTKLN